MFIPLFLPVFLDIIAPWQEHLERHRRFNTFKEDFISALEHNGADREDRICSACNEFLRGMPFLPSKDEKLVLSCLVPALRLDSMKSLLLEVLKTEISDAKLDEPEPQKKIAALIFIVGSLFAS